MPPKKIIKECELCGKRFTFIRSKYCSQYCMRRSTSIRKYGLTNEEYRAMVKDRKCNLCGRKMILREFNIDHDHATGEVYGPVCSACNMMLAVIRRKPLTAFRTLEYLTMPPARMVRGGQVFITKEYEQSLAKAKENRKRRKSSFRKVYSKVGGQ